MRLASRSASLTERIDEIWLPMWKWRSSKQSSIPASVRKRTASIRSREESPNFERSPPDSSQWPAPRADSRARAPSLGRTPVRSATRWISPSSDGFSTTSTTWRPSFEASSAVSTYSSSL